MQEIKELQKSVEKNLLRDRFLAPVAFVNSQTHGDYIFDLGNAFEDERTKEAFVISTSQLWKDQKVYKFILVTECWQYIQPKGCSDEEARNILEQGLHQCLFDRKEAFTITCVTRNTCTTLIRVFERKDDEIILGKEYVSEATQLDNFLPLQEALIDVQ